MSLTLFPLSDVAFAVLCAPPYTVALFLPLHPLPIIYLAVAPGVNALPRGLVVCEVTNVSGAILVPLVAPALPLVVRPAPLIDSLTTLVKHDAEPLSLSVSQLPSIESLKIALEAKGFTPAHYLCVVKEG